MKYRRKRMYINIKEINELKSARLEARKGKGIELNEEARLSLIHI